MITPRVSDIAGIINKIAPPGLAEEWDNVGLQVGDPAMPVQRILIALDASTETVNAAASSESQILLTHHPLIFHPLKKIVPTDPTGSAVFTAIKSGIAVISAHTNYDIAAGGVNDLLAAAVGVESSVPLRVTEADQLVKLAVYVPHGHEEQVMESLFKVSTALGNYRDCSFRSAGVGTFRPLAGASPFVGKVGEREQVEEYRLEVLLKRSDVSVAVNALHKVHPYEEPAYDVYPVLNTGAESGLGRIGRLSSPLRLEQVAEMIKERLGAPSVRLVGDPAGEVNKVALCGGSGAGLLKDSVRQGAQVLITGDIKYHEAREAESLGIALIDAGHYATEIVAVDGLAAVLRAIFAEKRYSVEVLPYRLEKDPFTYM